jgi:hypothetical protein
VSGPPSAALAAPADTSTWGSHTTKVSGTNLAGGSGSAQCGYAVLPATFKPPPALLRRFAPGRKTTKVRTLALSRVPAHAIVNVTCWGDGCPFLYADDITGKRCHLQPCTATSVQLSPAMRTVDMTPLFARALLARDALLNISVTAPNTVGVIWLFTMRGTKQPTLQASCLQPDSSVPGRGCTAPAGLK